MPLRRWVMIVVTALLLGLVWYASKPIITIIRDGPNGTHQKWITQEIEDWGREYSQVNDHRSAMQAARMIGYIEDYYVPQDDIYRSTPEIETALAEVRADTLKRIVTSLEAYTGLKHGIDSKAWDAWADAPSAQQPVAIPEH